MKLLKLGLFLTALMQPSLSFSEALHTNKSITLIHGASNSRQCAFLKLGGVSQADAVIPNSPWFSLPISHADYHGTMSLLLAAYMGDKPVTIHTTGKVSCSAAEIDIAIIGNYPT